MTQHRKALADLLRPKLKRPGFNDPAFQREFDRILDEGGMPRDSEAPAPVIQRRGTQVGLAGVVGAVAAAGLFVSVPQDEGTEYKAYRDIAGIWTICQGDTKNVRPGMVETREGCQRRLEQQLIAHAVPVMRCSPRLAEPGRDNQRWAAVSLAYNIGPNAFCRSSAARHFNAGNWRAGCDAFLAWNKARVGGQLRPVRGLTLRRQREREICLRGLS
jgi:lysozyme